MQFSDLEKHYILSRAELEYRSSIVKGMDESASKQVWSAAAAGWTDDQREEWKNFDSLMFQAYSWRAYEAMRLMMTAEALKVSITPVPPKVDLKEVEEAGFKKRTFVIGMYIAWFANTLWKKGEDEDQTQFERRKDFHDYEFGYLCKEAITDSTFPREEIHKELGKARDTVKNIASIVYNARNK